MKAMANPARKKAFEAYSTRPGEWVPVSLVLFIVCACSAALSLLEPLGILAGIALFFLPTLFASTQYLGSSLTGKEADTRIITRGFAAYFRIPCLGVYRFLMNGFFAFLASAGTVFFFIIAFYMIALSVDPTFASAAESISAAISGGDYEGASATMAQTPLFQTMYDVSEIVLGFSIVFFFWLFMGRYVQNGILRNAFHLDHPRLANFYYGYYRRAVSKEWAMTRAPFLPLPLVSILLGATTSGICFGMGVPIRFSLFFGLLAFSFLLSLYLPLIIYLHVAFAFDHQKAISVAFYEGSKKIYASFASTGRVGEDELARMREELDKMKPPLDEDEKK